MLTWLYEALSSPIGLVIATPEPEKLRQKLYALRRTAGDASLEALSLVIPAHTNGELWILKASPTPQ